MQIKRKELLSILQGMQTNSSKLDFSIANQVNFKNNYIYYINNDIIIYNKFQNDVSFSLKLNDLVNLLSKLKDKSIEFEIDNIIKIKTEKTEIELTKLDNSIDFNFKENFEWKELPNNFIKGIKFAGRIVQENNYRFLPNILIDNDKIVSTDGKCLIIYNLGVEFNKFYLQKNQIDLLLKYDIEKYCIEGNLIYFLSKDNTIICFNYLIDVNFPPYTEIKLENEKEIKFLDKLNLNDIEVNLSILDEYNTLDIDIDRNKIKIKTGNEYINIRTELEKENEIENIKFKLNAEYLLEFLKSDFSSEFKTFIDDKMICFKNDDVKFITALII